MKKDTVSENNITIDGNIFEQIENGFFKATVPYAVEKKTWLFDPNHNNMNVLCEVDDGKYFVKYLSNTNFGTDFLRRKFDELLSGGKTYTVLSGLSQPRNGLTIGELF